MNSEKENFQLEDLLAFYPPYNTPQIQTIISAKKEFKELEASTSEPVPKKGEYFKHQKLVQRLMRAVDKLLILHEAGTGKTCTMISVSEFYEMMSRTLMGMKNSLLRQGFPIKKTYVLVRNNILKDEFLNQLVCTCSVNKYDTTYVREAKDERSRNFRIKKEIERFYEVINYRDFSNRVSKLVKEGFTDKGKTIYRVEHILTDDQIRKEFSNCLFFADEIHNLRNVEGDFADMKEEDLESSIINYASLYKVLHTANNIKVMLATATPMINAPADLVPTLNLLLPEDQRIKDGTDFATWNLDRFEKVVRGMVSFVRVLDTGIDVIYEGSAIEGATLKVAGKEVEASSIIEASEMSPFQSYAYLNAELSGTTKGGKSGGIRKAARHASNFVFPKEIKMQGGRYYFDSNLKDGLYGKQGFDKWVEIRNDKYRFKTEFSKLLDANFDQNLEIMSSKFYTVITQCEEQEGNCFCFTDDFAVASGAILLGLCFEKKGYVKYDSNSPVFKILGQRNGGGSSFCSKDQEEEVEREVVAKKEKRYAILTSDTDQELTRKILTLFNCRENMNGEYIKIIIASRKAREGLNLANVQNIHLINPSWNQSNMYQAIYRAIRATSHVELLKKLKKEAIEKGEDPDKARVIVRIYQHCSILSSDEEVQEYSREINKPDFSVELQMYQHAEQKDRNNAVVMRMLKQCAIDCQINIVRNKGRDTDQDNSQICNYTKCDYECVDPLPMGSLDFTTYDVYYKDELVEKVKEKLQELFAFKNQYKIQEILRNITEFPPKFVIQGLAEMIKEKTPFLNRFGYTSFLSENGDLFFLMNELNTYSTENMELLYNQDVSTIGQTEYNENLYGVAKRDFYEMTKQVRRPFDEMKVRQILETGDEEDENLMEKIEKMDTSVKITLIENLLLKKRRQQLDENEEKIVNKYKNLIFDFKEPISLFEKTKQAQIEPAKPTRGRKKKIVDKVSIQKLKKGESEEVEQMEYGVDVLVHLLDLLINEKAGYRTTSRFQKADANIRILKSDENQWRDVTDTEKVAYNKLIQAKFKNFIQEFKDKELYTMYGTILQDNEFRIIDKSKESKKKKKDEDEDFNGIECKPGHKYQDLTDILARLNIYPENIPDLKVDYASIPQTEDEMKAYLKKKSFRVERMTEDEMEEAAKWISTGAQKDKLCEIIKDYFEKQQILFKLVDEEIEQEEGIGEEIEE
jgi:hypothetical protein